MLLGKDIIRISFLTNLWYKLVEVTEKRKIEMNNNITFTRGERNFLCTKKIVETNKNATNATTVTGSCLFKATKKKRKNYVLLI